MNKDASDLFYFTAAIVFFIAVANHSIEAAQAGVGFLILGKLEQIRAKL